MCKKTFFFVCVCEALGIYDAQKVPLETFGLSVFWLFLFLLSVLLWPCKFAILSL